jgi:RNA polymerase sigma-70 factor (ECF subfamily)
MAGDKHADPQCPEASASTDGRSARIAGWLAAARQGDTAARDRLFDACRSYVDLAARYHLQRRLRAKVDASDIVQQSLLEAHRGFDRFAGESPGEWLAWLKRIVVHNAYDEAKRWRGTAKRDAGREVPLERGDDRSWARPHDPASPEPSPSQHVLRGEQELLIAAALEHLPEDHRDIILLRNLERLPFEEVARRMGRSAGACRMLWMRAIASLRDQLAATAPGQ